MEQAVIVQQWHFTVDFRQLRHEVEHVPSLREWIWWHRVHHESSTEHHIHLHIIVGIFPNCNTCPQGIREQRSIHTGSCLAIHLREIIDPHDAGPSFDLPENAHGQNSDVGEGKAQDSDE
jgi:hypothetical protein